MLLQEGGISLVSPYRARVVLWKEARLDHVLPVAHVEPNYSK
jgi:hypothetical protein